MKINQENSGDSMLYCLSSRRHFKTIVDKYQLLLARKSGKTAFTLYLKSEHERDKWRKALTEAMYAL